MLKFVGTDISWVANRAETLGWAFLSLALDR